jgi:hypothetical protein
MHWLGLIRETREMKERQWTKVRWQQFQGGTDWLIESKKRNAGSSKVEVEVEK